MYVVTDDRVDGELLRACRLQLLAEVERACRDLEFGGRRLADLDPDGTVVASLPWLFSMSTRTTALDVTLWLGPAPQWGLRIRVVDHTLTVSAVRAAPRAPLALADAADARSSVSFPSGVVDELIDLWQNA